MKENIITVKEFKEKVWKIEGVKININAPDTAYVRDYPYIEPLPDDATVDDLKERINPCIKGIKTVLLK